MSTASSRMIYQMRLTADLDKGLGGIFSTEEDEHDQDQSFVYTIPLVHEGDDWRRYSYRFPGLRGEQYIEFEAFPQNEVLVVNADGVCITFSPHSPLPSIFPRGGLSIGGPLPYLGRLNLVGDFKLFLPIYPVSTIEMEFLYKEKGIVLVGLTPNFPGG